MSIHKLTKATAKPVKLPLNIDGYKINEIIDVVNRLDTNGIPYIGATGDVDLGNYELYSDGIHVDGSTVDPPEGPGITLAFFTESPVGPYYTLKSSNLTIQCGVHETAWLYSCP